MASFIIPSGILGLTSPRTIYLDNGVNMQNTMPKRVAKFGDGYSLSIPLGSAVRTISASFSGRTTEEINLIESYFAYLGADTIDNLTIFGESINATVAGYSKSFMNGALYSLNTQFKEVFRESY
jgi:hypothetical protein